MILNLEKLFNGLFKSKVGYLFVAILFLAPIVSLGQDSLCFKSISFEGNKKTRERILLGEMSIKAGTKVKKEELETVLERNKNNIYNLGLFTGVEFYPTITNDSIDLKIHLNERWYILPQFYLALEERTFREWWADKDLDRLAYGLGGEWKNFTGQNDKLFFYGQNGYSTQYTVSYNYPFIFPKPKIDFATYYSYNENKEIGYATDGGILQLARLAEGQIRNSWTGSVSFTKRITPLKRIGLQAGYLYVNPHDTISELNPAYLGTELNEAKYPFLKAFYYFDRRDWKAFPLKGDKINVEIQQSGLPPYGTHSFIKASAYYLKYFPLPYKFNFSFGASASQLFGIKIPFYEKNFLGFQTNVRGFESYVISGTGIQVLQTEIKWGLIERKIYRFNKIPFKKFNEFPLAFYITLFNDIGTVQDNSMSNQDLKFKNSLLWGYGVGINILAIYDAHLRLEYSFNNYGTGGFNLNGRLSLR